MRGRRTSTIAAVVAAAAALAGCGGGAETTPATTAAASADTAVTEDIPATTVEAATTAGTETGPATTAETETEAETEAETETEGNGAGGEKADAVIRIENGEPVGGTATVKVKKGDRVRIVVRADAEDELHLHGYDIEKAVGPGKPAVFDFVAEFEGIFELESHHAGTLVAKVVVEP
jgi:hypothetical protein